MFQKSRELKFLLIPGIIFFCITFISFGVSSFYDLEVQEFLAKGFQIFSSKMWIIFFDVLGNFQFFLVIFIFLSILWKSFFTFWKNKTKKHFY
ncbi:hypothetical protein STAIW_v1c02710 [Spiroplasma taiwanense CT-1]|uniref:Uncharacterized protein n=1 Tax=Spiroplasma taiwanense CT-1 TaxID=1276220 RepID=S5MGF0_9MOLU|nr:hypothetical protein STAIW_v1c02710 [Spiroplasma taiwanense CT-1]